MKKGQIQGNIIDIVILVIAAIGTIMGGYGVYGVYTSTSEFVRLGGVVIFLIFWGSMVSWSISKSEQ